MRNCKPAGELVVSHDTCCEEPSVSIMLTIISETTAIWVEGSDEIGVGDSSSLKFLPEESSPAALKLLAFVVFTREG